MTKLQIVKLTERDQRDIYNLCYHHEVVANGEPGIESPMIAELCAKDWGALAHRDPDDRPQRRAPRRTSAWTPISRP